MKQQKAEAALKVISGVARKADFEVLGLPDVLAIKSDGEHAQYRACYEPAVKDTSDPEERTFTWQGSTEHVDSMGDVILVNGWDLTRVKTGIAPLLLGHDSYPLPAGLLKTATKSGKAADGTRALDITARIHEQEIFGESEFGMWVEGARKLVANGTMKGSSVGFVPTSARWPDEKERETYGMPPYGMIFEAQELLELSMTPIPANRNASRKKDIRAALAQMVTDGQLDQATADVLEDDMTVSEDAWLRRCLSLQKTVVPITRTLPWVKARKDAPAPAVVPLPVPAGEPVELAFLKRIEASLGVAVAEMVQAVKVQARRETSAVMREIIEPAGDAITEAAKGIEDAAARLANRREDSARAEGSEPRAPNGAAPATAASTGTSRETPTNTGESKAGALLLDALRAGSPAPESTHAPRHGS